MDYVTSRAFNAITGLALGFAGLVTVSYGIFTGFDGTQILAGCALICTAKFLVL